MIPNNKIATKVSKRKIKSLTNNLSNIQINYKVVTISSAVVDETDYFADVCYPQAFDVKGCLEKQPTVIAALKKVQQKLANSEGCELEMINGL